MGGSHGALSGIVRAIGISSGSAAGTAGSSLRAIAGATNKMCGICGFLSADLTRPVDQALLDGMNASIHHRGPDSDGFYIGRAVGLAMRRLAIIDVVGGQQPMTNEDGSIHLVFNGEIYNFC